MMLPSLEDGTTPSAKRITPSRRKSNPKGAIDPGPGTGSRLHPGARRDEDSSLETRRATEIKFIVDSNAGKLARWLRLMGYDALFFNDIDDSHLLRIAMEEGRIVLTKDTQIMRRRVVSNGQLKAILIKSDDYRQQLRQVVEELGLDYYLNQFTRCLECNRILVPRSKEEVKELVPPYVFRTQSQYMQCPACLRLYWRGTHWQRMKKELEKLATDNGAPG